MRLFLIKIWCMIFFLFVVEAFCAGDGDGGLPGEFLRFGVGTRGIAMGRAYIATSEGAEAIYWNPAGLGGLLRWEFHGMHSNLYYDSRYDFFAFAYPIHNEGGLALGFVNLAMSELEKRNIYNTALGSFGVNKWSLMLGYGRYVWLKRLRVGVLAKLISESVDEGNAFGFGGIDIGIITKDLMRKMRLAVVIQGLGSTKIAEDKFPLTLKVGAQYRIFRPIILSLQTDIVPDMNIMPRFGVEWRVLGGLFLRAGYDLREYTFGFGYNFRRFAFGGGGLSLGGGEAELGYAAGITSEVGNDYGRVSLTIRGKERIMFEQLQAEKDPCEKLSQYEVLLGKEGVIGAGANIITGDCHFQYQSLKAPLQADPDFKEAYYYFREAYIGKFGKNWKDEIITNEDAKKIFSQRTHYMFAEATLHTQKITEETEALINDLIAAGGDSVQYDDRLKFDLAYCLEQLGKLDSATMYYEQIAKREFVSPVKIIAIYRLALLKKNREPEKAISYLNQIVNMYQSGFYTDKGERVSYPMFPKFKDNTPFDDALLMLGDIYRTMGGEENLRKALICYKNILLLSPDLDKTNIKIAVQGLADVYEQLGESELAKKLREKLL